MGWRRSRKYVGRFPECVWLWVCAVAAFVFIVFWLIPEVFRD